MARPTSTHAHASREPVTKSIACGAPYAGRLNANGGAPSRCIVVAAAPAAPTGRNRRSHSEPPDRSAARMPVKSSAAATGVPNRAPTVAAPASSIPSCGDTCGMKRAKIATTIAELIAMIGFSGPRLTPPARPSSVTTASPGSTRSFRGAPMSSVVTLSGPPWPGSTHRAMPTARPVTVSTRMIHHPDGSTPSASGSVVHTTPPSRSASFSSVQRRSALITPTRMAGIAIASRRRGVTLGSRSGIARLILGNPSSCPPDDSSGGTVRSTAQGARAGSGSDYPDRPSACAGMSRVGSLRERDVDLYLGGEPLELSPHGIEVDGCRHPCHDRGFEEAPARHRGIPRLRREVIDAHVLCAQRR